MAADESTGRITVSEEKIRILFLEFRQELAKDLEKFATAAAMEMLDARVKLLELWQAGVIGGGNTSRRFSDRALAWAALAAAVIGAVVTVAVVYH